MRLEEEISKALKLMDGDKYLLALAVSQRANDLSDGAKPLIEEAEAKKYKNTEIAILELSSGLLRKEEVVNSK